MSTSHRRKRRKRRKRSFSSRDHSTDNEQDISEPSRKKAKVTHNSSDENLMIDTDEDEDMANDNQINQSNDDDDDDNEFDNDADDIQIHDDDQIDNNNNNNNKLFSDHVLRNHRTCRVIVNKDLNANELKFKNKVVKYVNNYFIKNFKESNSIWIQQKNKYKLKTDKLLQNNSNIIVQPFAKETTIAHQSFLKDVAHNINTSKYLHITGNISKKYSVSHHKIDEMLNPRSIKLCAETCPIPHSTAYITVNRNHYVKDDKKLRYIPHIDDNDISNLNMDLYDNSEDEDTEFEEQEDILLDFLNEFEEIDNDGVVNNLKNIFYLNVGWIEHRIMSLSHHKSKLLKQQKNKLFKYGYDTKNKAIPIDSYSLLFCPRCMTYDCSLHGLNNPRRKDRALPNDNELSKNIDYANIINQNICDPNALSHINGNYSKNNDKIKYLLPKDYKTSVVYPNDLSKSVPCQPINNCYITYLNNQSNTNINPNDNQSKTNTNTNTDGNQSKNADNQSDTNTDVNQSNTNPNINPNDNNKTGTQWNYMDSANLRRLLNICRKNFCQIAAIMGNKLCADVYLKTKELIPNIEPYVRINNNDNDNDDNKAQKKRKMKKKAPTKSRQPIDLHSDTVPNQFFGCDHIGGCIGNDNCSCNSKKVYCEKFCNCSAECKQRFPGCHCKAGKCQTNGCTCFSAHRECDPDQCRSCQSYLPPNIYNETLKWLKINDNEYYKKNYQCIKFKLKSNNNSNKKKSDKEEDDIDEDEDDNSNNNNNNRDTSITILGFPDINPYQLCGNISCTQQRKKKLWIGRSDIHGFGCFAGENIKKSEYITEYLGEMISQNEADRRGKIYDAQNISYLFNLNEQYCIDATRKGCKMKFANHSINANCRAKIITTNGDHRICIYAKRDLQIGEELLFDYRHDNLDNTQQPQWFHQKG